MRSFWRNWLTAWCLGVVLFGAVLMGAAFPLTDAAARTAFALLQADSSPMTPQLRFTTALMGAVTAGWALTLLAVVRAQPEESLDTRLWRGITYALSAWFVTDSALSIATGFGLNAVSNTFLMALFLTPMAGLGVFRGTAAAAPR